MTAKEWIIAAVLRVYPAAWRREYGPEFMHLLGARPLSARVVGDVLQNALRQRLRSAEPSTLMGLAVMLALVFELIWNIAAPRPYGASPGVVKESSMTLPAVIMPALESEYYVLLLIACGCWTYLRRPGNSSHCGIAAMKVSFIAGIPVMIAGVLMLSRVLGILVVGPGDPTTTFHEHGFAYTYYNAQHQRPGAIHVLLAPVFRLPLSWIWGLVGGGVGRWFMRSRSRQVVS
jgi:hypothetical protein